MSGKRYSDEEEVPKAFRKEANKSKKKKGKGLKIFIIILLILLILIAGILGGAFWFVNNKFSKMQQIEINEEELNVSVQAEENLSEYRNIAIFGVDSAIPRIIYSLVGLTGLINIGILVMDLGEHEH